MTIKITQRNAHKYHCLTLLSQAKTNYAAARQLQIRADAWDTCAVGEAAEKLHVTPYYLIDQDAKLELWGYNFANEVGERRFSKARQTYDKIARRVKLLFGSKAKRIKHGLEVQ